MVDRVRLAELMTEAGGRQVIAEDLPAAAVLNADSGDTGGTALATIDTGVLGGTTGALSNFCANC